MIDDSEEEKRYRLRNCSQYIEDNEFPREYHEREADYMRRLQKIKSAHREMIFKDEKDEWI